MWKSWQKTATGTAVASPDGRESGSGEGGAPADAKAACAREGLKHGGGKREECALGVVERQGFPCWTGGESAGRGSRRDP
eukprot:3962619-Pleurochrysis_carterae.AAC.2